MGLFTIREQAAPATPAANYASIYIDQADGHLKKKDDAGAVIDFESTLGTVTSVTASAPLLSSGGATPDISIPVATAIANGYLSSADWTTFNNKQAALGFTPEDVANKATSFGTVNDTLYPSVQAVKTYADTKWALAGNTGTGGTAKLGTTDAQNFDIIAGNSTIITVVESYKGLSAAPTIVPADATSVNQFDFRTFVSPSASTTGASHAAISSQLIWDNPNAGFGNASGSLITNSANFSHNGSGTINYASVVTASANFNDTGVTSQFKGVTTENVVAIGATVTDYYGVVTGLNTTGGIVPTSNGVSQYANFTNATIGQATGGNYNLNFFGTTANSAGIVGLNSYIQLNDDTTVTNATFGFSTGIDANDDCVLNGIYGFNAYLNVRDNADVGSIYLMNFGLTHDGASVSSDANAVNINMTYSDTSDGGNVNLINTYVRTEDTANLSSLTLINSNPEIEGSSTIGNFNGANIGGNIRGSATVTNITGFSIVTQMAATAQATNFTAFSLVPQIKDTAVLTNSFTVINASPIVEAGAAVVGATGLNIDMSQVNLQAASIAAGAKKIAIAINDGAIEGGVNYTVPGAAAFFQQHYLGGSAIVASGDPVSAFGFGTNLAQSVTLHDDWTIDASGLGYVDVGFVGALAFDAGTTMARWTGALGGAGNPSGAGTLTDAIMFRGAGILPQGGALTVTNMYGFQVDPNLFGLVGTNVWGFFEDTSVAHNHLSKLAIGTTSKKVANSSTAFEIGNAKQLILGRGDTATKNALTAIEGGVFYDTDLNVLQFYNGSAWVNPAGGTYIQEAPAGAIDGVNQAFTLSQTPIAAACVLVYFNGVFQLPTVGYTIAGTTITTIPVLTVSETIEVAYIY